MAKRKGLKFLGIIIAVIIVVIIGVWMSINYVAGYLIEKYGSQTLGTQVTVSGVDISAFHGKASIKSLKIANPKGFSYPDILTLDQISIAVDTSTIKSDTIVVKSIVIDAPHLYYEQNDKGLSNLNVLQSNIEKNTASDKAEDDQTNKPSTDKTADETTKKPAKKVIIKNLIINDMAVNAKVLALANKELNFTIDEIQLTNVGQSQAGETTSQIIQQVLKVVSTKAVAAFTQAEINEGINSTGGTIKKSLNSLKCKLSPSSCE
ncbi:hypothetical protein L3V82_05000 [Thiotrichales bacterium 19S3-7]|nr:hypothetical protein [Thiotrichales bacterium 19S3-7]MCF6801450.1 hypothetical protein [Thiotrichales bacterium 19S3-11]